MMSGGTVSEFERSRMHAAVLSPKRVRDVMETAAGGLAVWKYLRLRKELRK